jgi:hypothetical protein
MAVRQNLADLENDPAKVGTHYTVRNPHPAFGIDPNIKNEYGHTNYPKYIDHPWKKRTDSVTTYFGRNGESKTTVIESDFPEQVMVKDEDEEKKVLAEKPPSKSDKPAAKAAWDGK